MKIKTAELTGVALDFAVAQCEGSLPASFDDWKQTWPRYSANWSQGGPIIEQQSLWVRESAVASPAVAHLVTPDKKWFAYAQRSHDGTAAKCYYGATFLIAAMRCYVASRLGDEVKVPDELANYVA